MTIFWTCQDAKPSLTARPVLRRSNSHGITGSMASVTSLHSLTLELPPSCIEFWPDDEQYAVVGTYNLETETPVEETKQPTSQHRNGSLILLCIDHDKV